MTDFSLLPDVIWVNVLSRLSLQDRAQVARVCHALNDAYNHPSLWHTIKIVLLGDANRYTNEPVFMPWRYFQLVKRFGAYFQDLTLVFHGYLHKIPPECEEVIVSLGKTCRLHTLTLEVGVMADKSTFHHSSVPRKTDLHVLAALVNNAFRLHAFVLRSWPMYPGLASVNLLENLRDNQRIKNLEKLSLFWQPPNAVTWASTNVILPSIEEILETVKHFQNLKCLEVRSAMINDKVIQEFTKLKRTPLERLAIMVTYEKGKKYQERVPHIKPDTWAALKEMCPDIQVELTIVNRMAYIDMATILQPEIPLSAINFLRYSQCTGQDIRAITDKYAASLCKFCDYRDAEAMDDERLDQELIDMVSICPKLNYFIFNGYLNYKTVSKLARLRDLDWYYFQVYEDNIITHEVEPIDENIVVGKRSSGEYFLVSQEKYGQSEEERELMLEDLSKEVSQTLGQKWRPWHRRSREFDPLSSGPGGPQCL